MKPKNKMKSSFDGKLAEIPSIYVDNFENPSLDGAKAYFLSHFHTDHTVGLGSLELIKKLTNKNNIFIYATKMCGEIIKYKYRHLKPFVKILNLGSNFITIMDDSNMNQSETYVNVTLIPAGHCLGSTMFLFETISTKVLYTGDFRIRANDLSKYASLHCNGEVIKLDALYVDTTFINTGYEEFPKRSESVEDVVHLIGEWLDDTDVCILLNTPANYAYEHVFNIIYKELQMKVYVDDDAWHFYSTIQHLVPGVTNDLEDTRIFLNRIPPARVPKRCKKIRFSAVMWDNWTNDQSCVKVKDDTFYRVCFSTHCSRSELISFVEYLNPVKVIGFPEPYTVKGDGCVNRAKDFVLSPKKSPKKHPCSGTKRPPEDRKVDSALLKKMFG